jgi:hypothetical protein
MSELRAPYVAVPTNLQEQDFQTVRQCFSQDIVVVSGSQVPVRSFSGPIDVQTAREFSYWLINIGPNQLWHLSTLFLTTYFGKKVIDGFATEAGKDFWAGVKRLFQFVSNRLNTTTPPPPDIRLVCDGMFADLVAGQWTRVDTNVAIDVDVPHEEELLTTFIYNLEQFVFPIIGCIMSTTSDGATISYQIQAGDYPVFPWKPFPWKWQVWDLDRNVSFWVDLQTRSFVTEDDATKAIKSNALGCLYKLGFSLSNT